MEGIGRVPFTGYLGWRKGRAGRWGPECWGFDKILEMKMWADYVMILFPQDKTRNVAGTTCNSV